MAQKAESAHSEAVDSLNTLVPAKPKRWLKIATATEGGTITALAVEWIEAGLAKVEKDQVKVRK